MQQPYAAAKCLKNRHNITTAQ